MSRWSHEYPERDYSDGSYFGRDAEDHERPYGACFFCGRAAQFEPSVKVVACQACRQQIADTQAERGGAVSDEEGGEEMTDYKAALEQAQADKFEADLKIISLEADAAITTKRANGYQEEVKA